MFYLVPMTPTSILHDPRRASSGKGQLRLAEAKNENVRSETSEEDTSDTCLDEHFESRCDDDTDYTNCLINLHFRKNKVA